MKNRRNICAATEAGFIHFSNLPGSIKTGCQLSPLASSKYCYQHAPRASAGTFVPEGEINKMDAQTAQLASVATQEGIIQLIVGKKTTRSQTYYQVIGYRVDL